MAYFITTYGYLAIVVGTFFEGETILVLAGFVAHQGLLSLPQVILCAFIGSLCGDQLFFFIGRVKGKPMLEKRPAIRERAEKVLRLLEQHSVLLMAGFRFLYGLRTVTPFVLGVSRVPMMKFVALNILGALLWAAGIGTLGYFFGNAVEVILGDIKRYEMGLLLGLIFLGLGGMAVRFFIRHKFKKDPEVKS